MESDKAVEGLQAPHEPGSNQSSAKITTTTTRDFEPHPHVVAAQVQDVLTLLLVFRFLNALFVRTFFQPDEYFQALEPAWSIAFGSNSGAWLTWEWQHQLRSSLHPAIFGLAYKAVDAFVDWTLLFLPLRATLLVALPGVLQSVFAALADFFTWKLASRIHGKDSNAPWAALWMTVLNPWQWYCSTRTFSNSLETTLTIAALTYWPWELLGDAKTSRGSPLQQKGKVTSLRISLVLAAVAVLLRPTNLLIWLAILTLSLAGKSSTKATDLSILIREIILCGAAVLAVSLVSDRLYFGFWTFPPYKWLYFNISQSLAVFYGHMPWHYYLSQGVPLLTTTFLPFALVGLFKAARSSQGVTALQTNTLKTLALAAITMIGVLSLISHKEVRFIYPLLPILHILAAPYIANFFTTPTSPTTTTTTTTTQPSSTAASPSPLPSGTVTLRRKITLAHLLSVNLLLAGYLTLFHQPAPLSVLAFLRADYERLHPDLLGQPLTLNQKGREGNEKEEELFALFLTPCHSTPWRSHLVYPTLRARALTCEPPLHTEPGSDERAGYLDEADRFYRREGEDGTGYGLRFLEEEMWPLTDKNVNSKAGGQQRRAGEIPRYIVGFEGIEPVLRRFFEGEGAPGAGMGVRLTRVWDAWNGVFNEDWRRQGRMVVWDTGMYTDSREGVEGEGGEKVKGKGEEVRDEL